MMIIKPIFSLGKSTSRDEKIVSGRNFIFLNSLHHFNFGPNGTFKDLYQ